MNFTRKRIRGQDGRLKRTWMDDSGNYRVTWAREIHGIRMESPVVHACVLTPWGWGFAGRRGLYKTVKSAKEACEFNKGLWDKFLLIEGRTKVTQVRDLKDRSWIGIGKSAVSAMSDIPSWVIESADPRSMEILCPKHKGDECDHQDDPTPASTTSDVPTHTNPENGPASDASDGDQGRSVDQTDADTKSAPPAKARAKAPAKRSTKPTKTQSTRGGRTAKRSTSTTKSSKKPSRRKKS